jgi:hypothetical protein
MTLLTMSKKTGAELKPTTRIEGAGNMILLGKGVLTWNATERRSDRYGAVWLMEDGNTSLDPRTPERTLDGKALRSVNGQRGTITAEVIDPRESTHIGDLFRGIFPSRPMKWESITLGSGEVFVEHDDHAGDVVGIKPDDGRDKDWLNPHALYRAHEQLVELRFHPTM